MNEIYFLGLPYSLWEPKNISHTPNIRQEKPVSELLFRVVQETFRTLQTIANNFVEDNPSWEKHIYCRHVLRDPWNRTDLKTTLLRTSIYESKMCHASFQRWKQPMILPSYDIYVPQHDENSIITWKLQSCQTCFGVSQYLSNWM